MSKKIKEEVREKLAAPSKDARGYTRWWWYGCNVEKEEIKKELDEMVRANIGGVELQIMYALEADDNVVETDGSGAAASEREDEYVSGINRGERRNHFYLSPEYLELVAFAAEEANKRGMKFDMTLGSSWPYGGPFVPEELSAPTVIPYTIDVKGPCCFSYDFTTRTYGEIVSCVMGRMENCEMVPDSIRDITDKVTDKYLFNWPWGKELSQVDIPEGDYKIVAFVSSEKRLQMSIPLPGGEGYVIDHNRADAARLFFACAGNPIVEAVKKGHIQSFFCDSIETPGHNWTEIIFDEFRSRRGYELRPYVYALWGEIQGMTDLVRYDFQKTMAELTVENFFQEMTKWCHEKGCTSRIQAHGTWGDILMAYGAADIPEGETFSAFDRYEVNTVHRKLASSAGHVYNKKIISNESFTWLRFPRFVVTLENMKAAVDSIFLDGMNQIVNHGYSYSPRDSGQFGQPFYASTNINHKNTWWKHYPKLGLYMNRVCEFLRRGETVIRTAVYLPQSDIWAENPISDLHMCMKLDERLTSGAMDHLHKSGYWFDYVNDDVVLRLNEYSYDTLILVACDRMPLETARAMREFAVKGGLIICAEDYPRRSCGLLNYEERSREVREIMEELAESGKMLLAPDRMEGLTDILKAHREAEVQLLYHPDTVGYVHQREAAGTGTIPRDAGEPAGYVNQREAVQDIYFFANISGEGAKETICFSQESRSFCVFDPMTGLEKGILSREYTEKGLELNLLFEPYQSLLVLFGDNVGEEPLLEQTTQESTLLDLSRGWTFAAKDGGFQKAYDVLNSWEQETELRYFSGEGIYQRDFVISDEEWEMLTRGNRKLYLCLEHLGETADVFVNGKPAGELLMHPYRLEITSFLHSGRNHLEIRVQNLLINAAIDPQHEEMLYPEPLIDRWPYSTAALNRNRRRRLHHWREREMVAEPLKSGLWGKIEIKQTLIS